MRIQKHLAYKYKDKEHYKHVLIVPEKAMESLGWKPGQELDDQVKGQTLLLKPTNNVPEVKAPHEMDARPLTRDHGKLPRQDGSDEFPPRNAKPQQHGKIAQKKKIATR